MASPDFEMWPQMAAGKFEARPQPHPHTKQHAALKTKIQNKPRHQTNVQRGAPVRGIGIGGETGSSGHTTPGSEGYFHGRFNRAPSGGLNGGFAIAFSVLDLIYKTDTCKKTNVHRLPPRPPRSGRF
jgi:hypothetical protein